MCNFDDKNSQFGPIRFNRSSKYSKKEPKSMKDGSMDHGEK